MKRIVVTGSECTGKTTLARALAEHYRTAWVPEVVRAYVEAKKVPPGFDDVDNIARLHVALSDRIGEGASALLILDTDLLSTWVYSHHYYGDCPKWIDESILKRRGDLYLLAGIDVPWQADGLQRDRGHMREEMQALFRDEIVRRRFRHIEIEGAPGQRLATAVRAIDELFV